MNPEPTPPYFSPFDHLRPELWIKSKVAHITLFSIGMVLMIPALYGLFAFVVVVSMWGMFGSSMGTQELWGLGSAMASISTGVFAWCGLGILFFKRTSIKWQRACWTMCAIFGIVTIPCSIGWWISAAQEFPSVVDGNATFWGHLLFFLFTAVAVFSAIKGVKFTRNAIQAQSQPPEAAHMPTPMPRQADPENPPAPPSPEPLVSQSPEEDSPS